MGNFQLKSQKQIQSAMLKKIMALLSINDINAGSAIDRLTFAASQEDFAQYVQMAKILRLVDVDNMKGTDLDNYAFNFGITRNAALNASGVVTVQRASTFVKVSTNFYSGLTAPIAGDTTINVIDASSALYSTAGTLILGRGTSVEEEVSYVLAPVNNTNYYTFTVTSGLAYNHAVEETVILKQNTDITILAGSVLRVPATSVSTVINYSVDVDSTLLAGEAELINVPVTAIIAGTSGNIPVNAINGTDAFASAPFSGARAKNESKFSTGKDRETDDELRDRIKTAIQSLSKGTKQAILNAIVGLIDVDSAQRVVSANVILPLTTDAPVKVYIDNGQGFEPSYESLGYEEIIDSATGGETRLQLDLFPLVKAQVETNVAETFDFSAGTKTLSYTVGLDSETISIFTTDFEFSDAATAEEVATAINARATLIEARTSQSGTKVVIMAKADVNEEMQVTGGTANTILAFPTDKVYTLLLYVDSTLLSKDGETAYVDSANSALYDLASIGAFPQTLTVIVDGKSANPQTVTFQSADFVSTTYATTDEVCDIINAQLAGATATSIDSDSKIRIQSNKSLSSLSKIEITGGTANDAAFGFNFPTSEVVGANKDYTLNKELGTIELETPLTVTQSVNVGPLYTRAFLRASIAESYLLVNGQTLVISVDGGANQTITFTAAIAGVKTAAVTAAFINTLLVGATASVRTVEGVNYLEITSNSYTASVGSIEIKSASTGNTPFGFTLDSAATNQKAFKAFRLSAAGPYAFTLSDTLVAVIDDDITNNTFSVPMYYGGTVTTGTSSTIFKASAFMNIFLANDVINGFYAAFTSGAMTTTGSGTVTTVSAGSGYMQYDFSATPTNMSDFAAGDVVTFSGMANSENDGDFIITATNNTTYVRVINASGIAESASTGTIKVGQRRPIADYKIADGEITVTGALRATPSINDTFVIMPYTISNLVYFMNNLRVTSLSLKANVEAATNGTKLQLSSKLNGSEGYVQITGGNANLKLAFLTASYRGLQAYNYYTGLTKVVHQTIYGDDTDLVSFPGIGAAGIQFQVLAPTVNEVSLDILVTLKEGLVVSQVSNEILSQTTGYVNSLKVGEDLILEEIRAAIITNVSGVTDVSIVIPLVNVSCADNQVIRTRSSLISIG